MNNSDDVKNNAEEIEKNEMHKDEVNMNGEKDAEVEDANDDMEAGDMEKETSENEDASGEARKVKKMADPKLPSAEEVREHQLTHLPYRSWCKHCVRGRGQQQSHKTSQAEDRETPEIHMDFCFLLC